MRYLTITIVFLMFYSTSDAQTKAVSYSKMVIMEDTMYAESDTTVFNINLKKSEFKITSHKKTQTYKMSELLSSKAEEKLAMTINTYYLSDKDAGKFIVKLSYMSLNKYGVVLSDISMVWSNVTLTYLIDLK